MFDQFFHLALPSELSCIILFICFCFREANQLAAVLKEMKAGLDVVTTKVRALTAKVGSLGNSSVTISYYFF